MAEESPVDVQADSLEKSGLDEPVTADISNLPEDNLGGDVEPTEQSAEAPEEAPPAPTAEEEAPPAEEAPVAEAPAVDASDAEAPPADAEAPPADDEAPLADASDVVETSTSEPGQNNGLIPQEAQQEAQAAMSEQQFESNELPTTYTATSGAIVKNEPLISKDDYRGAPNATKTQHASLMGYRNVGASPTRGVYSQPMGDISSGTLNLGATRPLTFTGPPTNHRAKPHTRCDFSHNSFETMKITNDNIKLCNRLVEISKAPPGLQATSRLTETGRMAPASVAAATINRSKAQDHIAQENLRLYKRLQAVKPSKDVSRDGLAKDYKVAKGYAENARKFREGSTF